MAESAQELQTDREPAGTTRLTADEIYENIRVAAKEEMERTSGALFWSAVAAGLTIGFSFFAAAYLSTLASEPWKGAARAAGYPLGFIFVVLARGQLFTENTLEPIVPLLHTPTWKVFRALLALWGIVLLGNLIGAAAFAAIAALTPMVDAQFQRTLLETAQGGTSGGFGIVVIRGIYAGWLIALMAWLIASTRATGAQVILIWITTAPIAALGFRHSIAGSVEAFYQACMHAAPWLRISLDFIVPALIGNIIGGVVFVALLNHGQVSPGRSGDSEEER